METSTKHSQFTAVLMLDAAFRFVIFLSRQTQTKAKLATLQRLQTGLFGPFLTRAFQLFSLSLLLIPLSLFLLCSASVTPPRSPAWPPGSNVRQIKVAMLQDWRRCRGGRARDSQAFLNQLADLLSPPSSEASSSLGVRAPLYCSNLLFASFSLLSVCPAVTCMLVPGVFSNTAFASLPTLNG